MALVFHDADDDHAPFPHRVIIIPERTVSLRDPYSRKLSIVTYPRREFVICAQCDHWIMRDASACDCDYKCHELGELLAELASNEVSSEMKGSNVEPSQERQDQ